jgi:hypothetical protein
MAFVSPRVAVVLRLLEPPREGAVIAREDCHQAITAAMESIAVGDDAAGARQRRQVAWASMLEADGRFEEALADLTGHNCPPTGRRSPPVICSLTS